MSSHSKQEPLNYSMPELIDFDSKSDNPRSIVEDDSSRFVNKTIVITGAGGMLGREGCIFFCKRGARVAALDQDKAALKETFLALQTELGHEGAFCYALRTTFIIAGVCVYIVTP
jgi:FlaA1/EpsC-like NDP-sugar epimerase